MIVKPFGDEIKLQILHLRSLMKKSDNPKQKTLIQSDLTKLENGYNSEKQNAYYLDFEFSDSRNIIVLHDIRLEHKGKTAQIDHLLISRMGITILESKSFAGTLTIQEDGSLFVKYRNNSKTYPSPVEQNNRHQKVLENLINDMFDLPLNIKLLNGPTINSHVLIHPNTTITNKKLPDNFSRADTYVSKRKKEIDSMSGIDALKFASKLMTIDKAMELAFFLIEQHKPLNYDFSKKYPIKKSASFKVNEESISYGNKKTTLHKCTKCKSSNLEIRYRYNYFFKCLDCGNNIAIKHNCNTSQCAPKTKKIKNKFFKVCDHCGIEELFFENKT